ncbi:hypothetical protein PI124_g4228 [Phytophthora idaei]|nr:hypothetical protein PI125_g3744 [Phytophthora idaei]KAG3167950.1 hypothetical protein PI126_g3541 [Phytophthora idaei]KAG3251131.1 hypothetical protein PI124_g4228 [Phytophthora idaei]
MEPRCAGMLCNGPELVASSHLAVTSTCRACRSPLGAVRVLPRHLNQGRRHNNHSTKLLTAVGPMDFAELLCKSRAELVWRGASSL